MVALLLVLAAIVLSPVLFADFIRLDDHSHLFENPHLRRMSVAGLGAFWVKPYFNLYIPMTYSVWWFATMVASLFGPLRQNAWLFHALNLAVHLANTALIFGMVQALVAAVREKPAEKAAATDRFIALIAALLFALHPVQVETVAWISELKGELAMLFGLLGLWCHVRGQSSLRTALLTALLFMAAMLSKPVAIVFPVITWLVNRVVFGVGLRKSVALPAVYATLLLPFVLVTKRLQPDTQLDFIPGLPGRLSVAADAFTFYLSKVLAPFPLAVDYGRSPQFVLGHMAGARIVPAALVMLAAIAVTVSSVVRPPTLGWRRLLACGWTIFFASIAPILGLVPFGFQQFSTVADHYLYVPLVGISLMVAGALSAARMGVYARAVPTAVLLVFAVLSFRQARLWRTTESLFEHTVHVNPKSYLGYYSIAQEQLSAGRLDEAIASATTSLSIDPGYLNAEIVIGLARVQKGDYQEAIDRYNAVLARNPSTVGTRAKEVSSIHNNLGTALYSVGRVGEAVEHYRKAVALFPRSLNAHLNLGNVAFEEERYADAIAEYEIAQAITPDNPAVEQRLARARQAARQLAPSGEVRRSYESGHFGY